MLKIAMILFVSMTILNARCNSPKAPTNLTLTPTKDSVTLSWHDNSDSESGFKLFRNGEFLTKVPANSTTYDDQNLNPNTKYTYLILAYDDSFPSQRVYVKTKNNQILANQKFDVYFRGMSNDAQNWVAIFQKGAESKWDNVISWNWANGNDGKVELDGVPEGEYDLRAYFKNSYKVEDSYTFSVKNTLTKKKLILAQGGHWAPNMAENLVKNYNKIKKLPFSGYAVVGNHYTARVMTNDSLLDANGVWHTDMTYDRVASDLKGLKDLYKDKDLFMTVWTDFPGDYWDDAVWNKVKDNFAIVAKVAKDMNFKGIIFDNEPYDKNSTYKNINERYNAKKMINFKFPTKDEVAANPQNYSEWEKKGSAYTWVDEHAYRNMNHTFLEHTDKVTERFSEIMRAMVSEFPDIRVLVYHTPALAHENYNKDTINTIDQSLPRSHELYGAIFTGLKNGVSQNAKLYDMGEMYKYRVDYHFENAYQFRKYNIAKDAYNSSLDESYQWVIPSEYRSDWSKKSYMGFMAFNADETRAKGSDYDGFDTKDTTKVDDIKSVLELSIKNSDEYAIYYCEKQNWLSNADTVASPDWLSMMREVYDSLIK